ncbi:glucose-6-phosphate isomerase [Plesiocystis pacifica SIR-1]|uniref:Glucose-6-phosphate isomerase n=1 Tax=Plesiocystis pacifica SIR-1 TaxID=391625 RepID=A6FX57_9BACT|nr:glucose-6-phosphate isomerase [Plesiocystis pacifica]EDM81881.1 glucose-6-phosphate isomerase [Plesiocystis pacifica SIR-1]
MTESIHDHATRLRDLPLAELVSGEAGTRAEPWYEHRVGPLLADLRKHQIDDPAWRALFELAEARGVLATRDRMFAGEAINSSEGRPVLHVGLRARPGECVVEGEDIGALAKAVRERMAVFARSFRAGELKGATGEVLDQVVCLGIGGSELGPNMVLEALREHVPAGVTIRFLSNIDGSAVNRALAGFEPERTLMVVTSKTFTTHETLHNASSVRRWIEAGVGADGVGAHMAAATASPDRARAWGVPEDRIFEFWQWVGGRYSLWSAVGLPIVLGVGPERFEALLDGARELDRHFLESPAALNLPLKLALLGHWYATGFDARTHAVLPYDARLGRLVDYLQQVDMESNGKSVTAAGQAVDGRTGPVVWGGPGTNGQHAYFQLIHQGTHTIPADFLIAIEAPPGREDHHAILMANCLAQTRALMVGKAQATVEAELAAAGVDADTIATMAPQRTFSGSRPSTTVLLERLDPRALGAVIALYEHKVFCQGALWGLNSFDQWGVELGKVLAKELLLVVQGEVALDDADCDASTRALIEQIRAASSD